MIEGADIRAVAISAPLPRRDNVKAYVEDVLALEVSEYAHALAKELGVHVEVVFLVVTGVSDREDVIRDVIEKHLKYAGEDVPLHINRYFPAHKYWEPPTPVEVLEWACELARREGVKFVYLGNVPGHRYSHTYCPRCGELLIKRYNFDIIEYRLTEDKRCPRCGEEIPITGRYVRKGLRWIHLF